MPIVPGRVFAVPYPFRRGTYIEHLELRDAQVETWIPGVRTEAEYSSYGAEGTWLVADGMGTMTLTVVGIAALTRPYQSRVCFTRQWTSPDGVTFGKRGLHVATIEKFRRLCRGYAHEFEMAEPAQPQVAPVVIDAHDARIQAAFEGREVPA